MRILFDFTTAITERAGVARYTRNLITALIKLDQRNEYLLFSSERSKGEGDLPKGPNVQVKQLPLNDRVMRHVWYRAQAPLPVDWFTGRSDILHGPGFVLPPSRSGRRIVTIHDLLYLRHPEYTSPSLVKYLTAAVPHAIRGADRVVADSYHTADDLVTLLGVPREKISVIHLGVSPLFAPVVDPARLAALDTAYGLEHPLVLAIGTIEPRKNYAGLVAAFATARQAPGGPRTLAISGGKGWQSESVFAAVEQYGVQDAVKLIEYVPESDLTTLYSTADVVAMPALYEGFGLPVIEAMACGTPVVCSDGGSLPEVAGDAALVVPATDSQAFGEALLRVVTDASLRETLVARGKVRARRFTWEAAGAAALRIYDELA